MTHTESLYGLDDAILEILNLSTFTKRKELREQLTARGYFLKDRLVRKHVELLITEGQYAIASSEKGYSLITTPEALEQTKKYLSAKAFSIIERVKCLEANFKIGNSLTSGVEAKYPTMNIDDICMMEIPAEKNCVLFLWATVPLMPEAFKVMQSWGFRYKTMLTWRKIMSLGMGYWFRGQTEHLLLGIKGKVKPFYMQVPNFYQCKVGKHSEKPHYFRELIVKSTDNVFSEPKRIELFARDKEGLFPDDHLKGWDGFGNQLTKSISL